MFEQYGIEIALACAAIAIVYGVVVARWIVGQPAGNERMQQIAAAIQEGGKVLLFDAASGKLEERKIKAGLANWEYTEILDGLAAGDRIVTSLEKEGVKAGARVTPDDKAKAR